MHTSIHFHYNLVHFALSEIVVLYFTHCKKLFLVIKSLHLPSWTCHKVDLGPLSWISYQRFQHIVSTVSWDAPKSHSLIGPFAFLLFFPRAVMMTEKTSFLQTLVSFHCFLLSPVVKVPQKTLLMDALKEETEIIYDFCMCNPPFFANQLEAKVSFSPPQISYSHSV